MNMKNKFQEDIFARFNELTIAYNPGLARALGSINAALFLGQLLYWHGMGRYGEWTYKTMKEFKEETGLSRKQQEAAIRICKKHGFLETKLAQVPPKRHFKLNIEKLTEWLPKLSETDKLKRRKGTKPAARFGQNITENHTRDYPQRVKSEIFRENYQTLRRGGGRQEGFRPLFDKSTFKKP